MRDLKIHEIIRQNNNLQGNLHDRVPYKIKVLSNVTVNQLKDVLEYDLRSNNINAFVTLGNYDNIIQDSYGCSDENVVIIDYELINKLDKYPFFVENFSEDLINSCIKSITDEVDIIINNLSSIPVVIFNLFSAYGIYTDPLNVSKASYIAEKLNHYIDSLKVTNLHTINVDTIIAKIGKDNAFDDRMYLLSKTLYTIQYIKEYVYSITPVIYRYSGKSKKAIIFDCDNTLWKGILGEDGENGIDMSPQSKVGQIFNRVQQIASWLSDQGVIVGLCSKNNFEDVDYIFKQHQDIVLDSSKVTVSRINWQDKATNLTEIAQELNIGLDSFIFVDDSSFEINLINEKIPEVYTLQVPAKLEKYPQYLLETVNRFFYLSGSKEDFDKGTQYKQQFQRSAEKKKFTSIDDYLISLGITIDVRKNDVSKIERIAQLTQKTNQFNLTTKRYAESQIEKFMHDEKWIVFSFEVSDKFGNSGLTAVCILNIQGEVLVIDTFLMSCRIMGRNIEYAIINYIIEKFKNTVKYINASYSPTAKNKPVEIFYDASGFAVIGQDELGNKKYEFDILNGNKISIINSIGIRDGQN